MNDPKRFRFGTQEFYIKSAEEMHRLFAHAPETFARARCSLPERCALELDEGQESFPEV